MQYTLRNIPKNVDRQLRERARRKGKSLNEVTLDALKAALRLEDEPQPYRDLQDIAGSWIKDAEVDRVLDEQRKIDPESWV